jgi:hypothetical protein
MKQQDFRIESVVWPGAWCQVPKGGRRTTYNGVPIVVSVTATADFLSGREQPASHGAVPALALMIAAGDLRLGPTHQRPA